MLLWFGVGLLALIAYFFAAIYDEIKRHNEVMEWEIKRKKMNEGWDELTEKFESFQPLSRKLGAD